MARRFLLDTHFVIHLALSDDLAVILATKSSASTKDFESSGRTSA